MRPQLKPSGLTQPSGDVHLTLVKRGTVMPAQTTMHWLRRALREGLPTLRVSTPHQAVINTWRVRNMAGLLRGMRQVMLARALRIPTVYGALWLEPIYRIGQPNELRLDLGLVGLRVVTTAGVGFVVDAFQGLVEPEIMKYHGLGTGSTSEDASDTALVTELTTQYTGNVRATGNLAEGASANIYHTEATNTLDETPGAALREHGLFSATSSGVLFDRTVYASITLSAGDGLLSKYEATFAAGS